MHPEPGQRVGPYEILSVLGRGGMGTVYIARDSRLGRRLALKFLQPGVSGAEPDAGRQLLREARAASALHHPNICHIYDVGGDGAEAWIAMEYIEGPSLSACIRDGGMPPADVIPIAAGIARGLAHAHRQGIVHRDLKSANVVCDLEGHPKILDFGIAVRTPEAVAQEVTRTETGPATAFAGSLPYMAPEVLRGEPADQRTDLWSMGVILYELLAGCRPFHGRNAYDLASAIVEGNVPPLPASVPADLSRIVQRLLARNPRERYPDAEAVAHDLDTLSRGGTTPRPARRGLIVLIAVGALVGAFLVWRAQRFAPLRLSEQRLISTVEASHRAPSYSPDGSMLAFTAPDAQGVPQVWVRNLSQGTSIQITSAAAPASRPRWSPLNDRIVYGLEGQGLWSVAPLGGAATRLLDRGANPNFSRDGARLVFEDDRTIWTANADGSAARRLDGVPTLDYPLPMGPAFSPDGSQVAFFRAEMGPNGDLWTIPSGGGRARQLTSDLREGGWPVWTPDGRAIVFSSARGGSRTLWQVPARGGSAVALTISAGEDDQPDIAADGRHLAYTNVRNTWDLRVRDLTAGDEHPLLQRGLEILFPMFSSDGRRIVFFGRADYAVAVFTIGADGSDLRQLTGGRELNHQPRWGPGDKDVFFFQVRPELSFRRVSALGGPSTKVRDWDWMTAYAPSFDPTGRYIAYVRQPPQGTGPPAPQHTAILELATGREVEWPEPHTDVSGWSADGREIIGTRHDDGIYICRVADASCREVIKGSAPVWPGGHGRIFFARPADSAEPQELWSVAEDGSDPRREADLGVFRPIDRFFHVSPDARHVVWAPFRAGRHEVWTATLR